MNGLSYLTVGGEKYNGKNYQNYKTFFFFCNHTSDVFYFFICLPGFLKNKRSKSYKNLNVFKNQTTLIVITFIEIEIVLFLSIKFYFLKSYT